MYACPRKKMVNFRIGICCDNFVDNLLASISRSGQKGLRSDFSTGCFQASLTILYNYIMSTTLFVKRLFE